MNKRIEHLRAKSIAARPSISIERAQLLTRYYRANEGARPVPILRARAFRDLCQQKTLFIGPDELIVGERGPAPKAVPTFPELTCHSAEDLRTLRARELTRYEISDEAIAEYESEVVPYWSGRTLREAILAEAPERWRAAYDAGVFTEFMEQRAPGHTALDGEPYRRGLLDQQARIEEHRERRAAEDSPETAASVAQLEAMWLACDAALIFARRHAQLARELAAEEPGPRRKRELERIATVCSRVPAHAPRTFHEALQAYWFAHLGTITELNGWDAMNPGHLDRHLLPYYERELAAGTLDREGAKELLACLWIKFNNHPAPPKVGVTAKESGTYNDFTNINLGGLLNDGADGTNVVSELILEVADELHLLQPQVNVQVASTTPEDFLRATCRVVAKGYGYPALFNADVVVAEQVRVGKSVEDARSGGTSGCIETGSFGKEAYFLTGYLNLPKILELCLNDGVDPQSGERVGPATGDPRGFGSFEDLFAAFRAQLRWFVDVKLEHNDRIEALFAERMPAPFLSVLIRDCIAKARDYNAGGARYNTSYIQCCGLGTTTDCLSALQTHVFAGGLGLGELLDALRRNYVGGEALRQRLWNRTPKFGNDDDEADALMQRLFAALKDAIDGRPNPRGGTVHFNILSTTCHVYFGTRVGATPDGRLAGTPISDGASPAQGADRRGPTAVCRSLAKMDQRCTGGTLLNQRFLPQLLADEVGIRGLAALIRTYFRLGGHHIQFNVVDTPTLRDAQEHPGDYRDLLVRVAGYSDYFVDMGPDLQEEVIARTVQDGA